MAESDTHLPKKVFKAEKRSYIDDEKKHRGKREKGERFFRRECELVITNLVQKRMGAIVCMRICVCVRRKNNAGESVRENVRERRRNDEGKYIDDGRSSHMACVCKILRK